VSQLIRLVYASRSTFTRNAQHQGLDPGVARILAKSRRNNAQRQIVGGLLFGDGCFLQCLEGDAEVVDALYAKIEADRRHSEVTVLSRSQISQRSFGAWSMKYVPGERALRNKLHAWGAARFDPYGLTAEQIMDAVELMRLEADAVNTVPGDLDNPLSIDPAKSKPERIVAKLKPSSIPATQAVDGSDGIGRPLLWLALAAAAVLLVGTAAYWGVLG
jgi:hypothetical protein